jgi:hypothetical protein
MKRAAISLSKFPGANLLMLKFLGVLLTTFLPVAAAIVEAQQPGKVAIIGELLFRSGPDLGPGRTAFRQRLREFGYVEGKNIAYETRSAQGKVDRFSTLAEELVRSET